MHFSKLENKPIENRHLRTKFTTPCNVSKYYEVPTARRNAKLQTFMRRRAGLQSAPLNSTPDGLIGAKKSARLYLFKKEVKFKISKYVFT